MRVGVDRNSGELLTGWDECAQSIAMIAETAIGSLPLARDFGSNGPMLLDRPMTPPTIMDHFMAIAEALRKWEPGYRLRQVTVNRLGGDGVAGFIVSGDFYPNGHLGDYSVVENGRGVDVLANIAGGRI